MRRTLVVLALVVAACGSDSVDLDTLEAEPILQAYIAGLSSGQITNRTSGERPTITKLYEVAGSWEAASVAVADAVQAHGWEIESINCVGTGNDVIAKRQIADTWVLLESGAGTRGAGLILSIDQTQRPPSPFTVTGSCQPVLIDAAQS